MKKRRNFLSISNSSFHGIEISEQLLCWILRILVPLQGHRQFVQSECFYDESLAYVLDLEKWIDNPETNFEPNKIRQQIRESHQKIERSLQRRKLPRSKTLEVNLTRLTVLGGLSDVECQVLEFAIHLHDERILQEAADMLGNLSSSNLTQILALLLDLPERDVRIAISAKSALSRSGLLTVDRDGPDTLCNKLKLLSSDFADTILHADADPITLLRDIIIPSKPATLVLADFDHISPMLKVLNPYLRHVLDNNLQGVNILLYGIPGTGKSELSRLLAQEFGCELYEVTNQNEDGDPINGARRLRAYGAAQKFFSKNKTIIVFDEVEDVLQGFDTFSIFEDRKGQICKAWVNRMLEDNLVPAFWVSNSVRNIDPAFIRRFDMVIEMPVPPKRQREIIVRNSCNGILPTDSIARIAEAEGLAPAVITRAVSVVQSIGQGLDEKDIPAAIEMLIGNTLEAQGYRQKQSNDINCLPETYDPSFINADTDLGHIAEGLKRASSGRFCLYGPPGTGKTAFGRWLADRLEVPLAIKRASDLLGMFVGETEHNIAKAFRNAQRDGALLLIDEVDSFLQDRRRLQKSWEVTAVNEMLTQMESFSGVFIASTNLMDGLDQASFRRFDLKICFGFLKTEQAWRLFNRHCEALALPAPHWGLKTKLDKLSFLTPGDFAVVSRQNRFRPIKTPSDLLAVLEKECLVKENCRSKAIGFL